MLLYILQSDRKNVTSYIYTNEIFQTILTTHTKMPWYLFPNPIIYCLKSVHLVSGTIKTNV